MRVRGESEVVVRGEVVQGFVRKAHERTGRQGGHAQAAAEVAVVKLGEGFLQEVFEHYGRGFLTAEGAESTEERFDGVVGL